LKFKTTDTIDNQRDVYLALNSPEPNVEDQLTQWPEKAEFPKDRTTEIEVVMVQPNGEEEQVTQSIKVTEGGGRFWTLTDIKAYP